VPGLFAERFGLFLIILLGEVLVEAGHEYLWLLAAWVLGCAALSTRDARGGTRTHNATVGSPF
jgi:hypothetical protein